MNMKIEKIRTMRDLLTSLKEGDSVNADHDLLYDMCDRLHPATYVPLHMLVNTPATAHNEVLKLVDLDAVHSDSKRWVSSEPIPLLTKYLDMTVLGESYVYSIPVSKEEVSEEVEEDTSKPTVEPKEEDTSKPTVEPKEEASELEGTGDQEPSQDENTRSDDNDVKPVDYTQHTQHAPTPKSIKPVTYTLWQRFKIWWGFNP